MDQPLIAVRIKDGIFVGNVTAAHDEDFLVMNKCTHVINCAGSEVRDLFNGTGIQYLTFQWKDTNSSVCTTVMFDSADRNIESATRFIDRALENGECVLIHSYFGVSRSCALCAAYLMTKYGWNVDNALQFMSMAHQDMDIKPYFLRQLKTFAKRHDTELDVFDTRVDDGHFALDNEQWALRNTFVNGLVADVQETHELYRAASNQIKVCDPNFKNASRRRRRITFSDTKQGTSVQSELTQPLAVPERVQHHVDPATGASFVASRTAPGAPPPQPILARRGTPNSHRLESEPHVAKGRQVLALRAEFQVSNNPNWASGRHLSATTGSRDDQPQTRNMDATSPPPDQQQQQQSSLPYRSIPSTTNGGNQQQQEPQNPRPLTLASPVAIPLATTGIIPMQQQQQRVSSPMPSSAQQQQQQQLQPPPHRTTSSSGTTSTKIASPFTLSAAQGQVRRGSPLPKRQPGSLGTGGSTTYGSQQPSSLSSNAAAARGRPLTHPAVAAAATSGGSRTNSPMAQQQPAAQRRLVRAGSPQQQQQSSSIISSAYTNPTVAGQPAPRGGGGAGNLPYGSSSSSYNANTSVSSSQQQSGSGGSIRGNPTSHYVFQQAATSPPPATQIPNANATVQRYSTTSSQPPQQQTSYYGSSSGGSSNVRGAPISAVPTTLTAPSGNRTNSPLARRAASPQQMPQSSSSSTLVMRTSSPLARAPQPATAMSGGSGRNSPARLAEQYLSAAAPASAYGRETNASLLRKNMAAQRR